MSFQNFNKAGLKWVCSNVAAFIILLLISQNGIAQLGYYGNEWLQNAGNTASANQFYKLKVAEPGVYRVYYDELNDAGFALSGINPSEFQLWRRGTQQSIIVNTNGNSTFDSGDYIEFFGQPNDGLLDKYLYLDSNNHVQTNYSNYTDTAAYILTLGTNALRTSQIDGSGPFGTFEPEHKAKKDFVYTNLYYYGKYYFKDANGSKYEPMAFGDTGEGWFGSSITTSGRIYTLTGFKNVITTSGNGLLQITMVSTDTKNCNTIVQHKTTGNSWTTIDTITTNNYQSNTQTYSLPSSALWNASNDGNFYVRLVNLEGKYAVCANIHVEVPQATILQSNEEILNMEGITSTTMNLDLENGTASTFIYDITEEGNFRKITCEFNPGSPSSARAKFDHRFFSEKLFVTDTYKSIPGIEPFTFISPDTLADYLLVTHPRLTSSATDYRNYRESAEGGNYRVELSYVNELYNTFSYGDYTPVAIRRYCDYMTHEGNARFLLLLGKGFLNVKYGSRGGAIYQYTSASKPLRKRTIGDSHIVGRFGIQAELDDLVPSAGIPGSDNWYSTKLDAASANSWAPLLATGRISALTNEEVTNYLDKVIEYEAVPDTSAWKKEVLHLAGGYSENEINQISSSMTVWKGIAEGPHYAGNVSTISRPKLNNQTTISKINVSEQVNKGLHLMTFFGHSDYTVTDIDIGKASNPINQYNNDEGEYPLILLNGCNSGNCYVYTFTFGEDWVNFGSGGSIGFIGHSDIGLTSSLSTYTTAFYRAMFQDSSYINAPVGIQIQHAIENQITGNTPNLQVAHALQMVYQGDPAVRLFKPEKTDLAVSNSSLFLEEIDGEGITAVSESFNLGIAVRNYGWYNETDSFFVSVRRVLPDGTIQDYPPHKFGPVKQLDTIYYEIASKSVDAFGINEFMVHIDYNFDSASVAGGSALAFNQNFDASFESGSVDEVHETNNEARFQYYMPLSSVRPLFPKEFSIINNDYYLSNNGINFTAQSTDLLVTSEQYYLELDTNRNFESPLLSQVAAGTALVTWNNIPLPVLKDTTVYYWRVRFNNIEAGTDTLWEESSFTYISNSSEGWAQAHYQQFFRDSKDQISMNEDVQEWEFEKIKTFINIKLDNPSNYSNTKNSVLWNNQSVFLSCDVGTRVFVVDPVTLLPVNLPTFDAYSCQSQGEKYHYRFDFDVASHVTAFQSLVAQLQDDYILVLSNMKDCPFNTWETNNNIGTLLAANFGINQYPTSDTVAYTMIGCKNCTSPIYEASHADTIIADVPITATKETGEIISTLIGPSLGWGEFHRYIVKNGLEGSDQFEMDVYGLNLNLEDSLLINNIPAGSINIDTISADSFPYLRLEIQKTDASYRTPPQLNNWLLIYDNKIPEGILITDGYDYSKKEYYEGQEISYKFRFRNISEYDFAEPLIVTYAFSTPQEFTELKKDTLEGILKAGEEIEFEFNYTPSKTYGDKLLQVFVNPRIQVEEYYYNNIWQIPVKINADNINPLLDVAFDGVHIMNRDIISPTPVIVMTMKDDNSHLYKTDTSTGVEIYWKYPGSTVYEEIELINNPRLEFTTASQNQDFRVEYRPEKLEDGIHYLAVNMSDVSGNKSGVLNYEIGFEVVNETTISKFYPYPNPFSTSTRFAYTLTGSEQPEDIKIQIMTLSGKIVREISEDELGVLKIGKHLTDYAWDGTDEFGDQLANGVYLYRVLTQLDGKPLEQRTVNAFTDSKTFTKEWGKLYILR